MFALGALGLIAKPRSDKCEWLAHRALVLMVVRKTQRDGSGMLSHVLARWFHGVTGGFPPTGLEVGQCVEPFASKSALDSLACSLRTAFSVIPKHCSIGCCTIVQSLSTAKTHIVIFLVFCSPR
jgi:hypothetical protein